MIDSYSTIMFDVGGTLLRFNADKLAGAYVACAAQLGIALDVEQARNVVDELECGIPARQQNRQVSLDADNGKAFWDEFYTDGFRLLGIIDDVSVHATQIREKFQRAEFETLFDDVLPTLDALKARGVQLGILSNFSPNLENVLKLVGIHHYFSFFVVSGIAGFEKPDPRIFDLAVQLANCPRDKIVYVGDSVFHDVEGAREAGIPAILVDRFNRYPDFIGTCVRDLRELVE